MRAVEEADECSVVAGCVDLEPVWVGRILLVLVGLRG